MTTAAASAYTTVEMPSAGTKTMGGTMRTTGLAILVALAGCAQQGPPPVPADPSVLMDDPNFTLSWEPLRADIAASGDLGWTTGSYTSEGIGPDGEPRRGQGRYVTIWRKAADGSWKVVMDLGNPTQSPSGQ
jgi:ketosteroid isomerase-like protein